MKRILFAVFASLMLVISASVSPATAVSTEGGQAPEVVMVADIGGYPGHPNGQVQLLIYPESGNYFGRAQHTSTNTGTWAWLNTSGNAWPTQVAICIEDYYGKCTEPRLWDGGNFKSFAQAGTIQHIAYGRTIRVSGCIQFPDYYPNSTMIWHCTDIRMTKV